MHIYFFNFKSCAVKLNKKSFYKLKFNSAKIIASFSTNKIIFKMLTIKIVRKSNMLAFESSADNACAEVLYTLYPSIHFKVTLH